MKKTIVALLVAILAITLVGCGPSLPAECKAEGAVAEITLHTDEYFILGDTPWYWTGVSFQTDDGWTNLPISVGESFSTGLTDDNEGNTYYKWTIFRCGYDEFSIWETQNLLPEPPPPATPTPVAIIK